MDQFDDHEDILECGFAKAKFIYQGNTYDIQSCYFMPDSKLGQNFLDLFRIIILENEFENLADFVYDDEYDDDDDDEDENSPSIDDNPDIINEGKKVNLKKREFENIKKKIKNFLKTRKLEGEEKDLEFEVTIQNKNGRILKYDSNSNKTTVVEEGDPDEDITPITPNQSNILNFNILLFFFLILIFV